MNHQELYKLLLTVQKNVRCPQCGKAYDFTSIQIRGIADTIVFLELACTDHMPLLATVSLAQQSKAERAVKPKEKISGNDVIEVYKSLKDFTGDYKELFNKNIGKNNTNNQRKNDRI